MADKVIKNVDTIDSYRRTVKTTTFEDGDVLTETDTRIVNTPGKPFWRKTFAINGKRVTRAAAQEFMLTPAAPAKQHWAAMDMAAANGTTVTQGHADYCTAHGHARNFVEGGAVDASRPFCPRCGEKTTPIAETLRTSYLGGGKWEVYEANLPNDQFNRKHLGVLTQGITQAWTARKANGDRALINNHREYGGSQRAFEIALLTGWWN